MMQRYEVPIYHPVLGFDELRLYEPRHMFGGGSLATYCRDRLQSLSGGAFQVPGECSLPFQDVEGALIFAENDRSLLPAVITLYKGHILDIEALHCSDRFAASAASGSVTDAVIGTVPRAGKYRIKYFFFCLNEVLKKTKNNLPCHKLFNYHLSNWNDVGSPYYLREAFGLLGIERLHIDHYLPPGALSWFSVNPAVQQLLVERSRKYIEACRSEPALRRLSVSSRPWEFEPRLPRRPAHNVRFAFIRRDIIGQIASLISLYHTAALQCLSLNAADWSMEDFVKFCFIRFRPYVLFSFDGQIPLILSDCVRRGVSFAESVVERNLLPGLVADYALQDYAAKAMRDRRDAKLSVELLNYEDMMSNETLFFRGLCQFLAGRPLTSSEAKAVDRAVVLTSVSSMQAMEAELGHPLSYFPGLEKTFRYDSHMTSRPASAASRATIDMVIAPHAEPLRKNLREIQAHLSRYAGSYPSAFMAHQ